MARNSAASIAIQLQALANQATEKSFQYNTQEANTARTWQKMMSDTSHQREVEDLKKAGLNPVLSSGGQGAQSYTTSSASAQASDPTSAVGNVWSSQIGADATRAAAASNAAAMRYAANQQAAAARYAAAAQLEASKYRTDKSYDLGKYQSDKSYQATIDKPVGNFAGLIDKYAQKTGLSDVAIGSKTIKGVKSFIGGVMNNPGKLFKDNVNASMSNFNKLMTKSGRNQINNYLRSFGVSVNNKNRNQFVKAFIFGKTGAFDYLLNLMPRNSHSAVQSRYRGIQI